MPRVVGAALAAICVALGLMGLGVASVAAAPADDCAGVTVVVDLGDLPDTGAGPGNYVACTPEQGRALDVLQAADVALEGTAQMGLAFVCRVDGRPAPDEGIALPDGSTRTEPCQRTPPASAYWSLWTVGDDGAWRYATKGVSDLELAAGDAVALVYAVGRSEGLPPAVAPTDARGGVVPEGWSLRVVESGDLVPDVDTTATTAPDSSATDADGPGTAAVVGLGLLVVLGVGAVVVRARRSRG